MTDNPASSGEDQRIRSLDDQDKRIGQIETEQQRQGGLLEQIAAKIGAGPGDGKQDDSSAAAPAGDIQAQMADAVRAVRAEEKAAEAQAAHDAEHQALRDGPKEKTPREGTGWKERLEHAMFGKDRA